MSEKKNPILPLLINGVMTLGGIIADKRAKKAAGEPGEETPGESQLKTISLTRTLNLIGTPSILVIVGADIQAHGFNKFNLIGLGVAVVYSLGLAYITHLKEGGKSQDVIQP